MNINGSTISFPFRPDATGTVKTVSERSALIAQSIADVLETRQGERVMMPDYGIPDFVFSVVDFGFAARLAFYLEQQIIRYVPLVSEVKVRSAADDLGRATIEVRYIEVGEVNAPRNLVFPVWQYLPS